MCFVHLLMVELEAGIEKGEFRENVKSLPAISQHSVREDSMWGEGNYAVKVKAGSRKKWVYIPIAGNSGNILMRLTAIIQEWVQKDLLLGNGERLLLLYFLLESELGMAFMVT